MLIPFCKWERWYLEIIVNSIKGFTIFIMPDTENIIYALQKKKFQMSTIGLNISWALNESSKYPYCYRVVNTQR